MELQLDDDLLTGFEAIDEQHRLFLEMLGELAQRIEAGQHRQGLFDAIQGMRVYAEGHFADEEALQERIGYPHREAHTRLHATFTAMVRDLEGRLDEGPGMLSLETLDFLGAWFLGHIRNEDRRFAAHTQSLPQQP
jgi:hemerythrin-like metal-binding protein